MPGLGDDSCGPVAVMDFASAPRIGESLVALAWDPMGFAEDNSTTGKQSSGYSRFAASPTMHRDLSANTATVKQPKDTKDLSDLFICRSVDQWQSPDADSCKGLIALRAMDPFEWQHVADRLCETHGTKGNCIKNETIEAGTSSSEDFLQKIQEAAKTMSQDLEPKLAELICEDAQVLALTTRNVVPQAKELIMKLELFGENVCRRWHQDQYVCRSIVSYNCSATDCTSDINVDFFALHGGGKNEDIVSNPKSIYSANVGDMVMIKGSKFPGQAKGLVHKSPEVRYDSTGHAQTRLILKVDVLLLQEEGKCCDDC